MPAFSLLATNRPADDQYNTPRPSKPPAPLHHPKPPPVQGNTGTAPSHVRHPTVPRQHQRRQPVPTATTKLPPTPPSTASTTTANSQTSTTSPFAILSILNDIITAELTYWAHYTSTVATCPHYATLTSNPNTSTEAAPDSTTTSSPHAQRKVQALHHILETLPLRYTALATAYSDPSLLAPTGLSSHLQTLLESLRQMGGEEEEEGDGIEGKGELEGWYDRQLFQSKRFRSDVLRMDDEMRRLEASRMEELQALMLMVEELKLAAAEGLVGVRALTSLIEAMDEAGLSATGLKRS